MPKLSVIIPVYNGEKFVRTMLEAVAGQDCHDYEAFIIDDCSVDKTEIICRDFLKTQPQFQYVRQPRNRGVSAARNRGIELAAGEFCTAVDADDWIEKDIFTTLLQLLETNQADVGFSGTIKEKQLHPLGPQPVQEIVMATGPKLLAYDFGAIRSRSNPMFRTALIKNLRYYENFKASEDILFDVQALSQAQKAVYDPAKRYHYLVQPESAMHRSQGKDYFASSLGAQEKIYALVKDAALAPADLQQYYLDIGKAAFAMLRYAAKADDVRVFKETQHLYKQELRDYLEAAPLDRGTRFKLQSYLLPFGIVKLLHGGNKQNVQV